MIRFPAIGSVIAVRVLAVIALVIFLSQLAIVMVFWHMAQQRRFRPVALAFAFAFPLPLALALPLGEGLPNCVLLGALDPRPPLPRKRWGGPPLGGMMASGSSWEGSREACSPLAEGGWKTIRQRTGADVCDLE